MKVLLYSLFVLIATTKVEIAKVRELYKEAAHNKDKVEVFYELVSSVEKEDDVALVAYKGAALSLKAKYAKGIKNKTNGFKEGVEWVEYAIQKQPQAIEPRFVRLTIQENSPAILGYKSNIDEDKALILEKFKDASSDLKSYIRDYVQESGKFSKDEKAAIME